MSTKNEKYSSKSAMKRHEIMEGSKERKMEYGVVKPAVKKKTAVKGLKQMNFDTMGLKKMNLDKKAKKK
mgnify:CR=1 FL=1